MGRDASKILFHITIVVLSASIALTLPYSLSFIAKKLLLFWSFIENEQLFMVAMELGVAVVLIAVLHKAAKNRMNRTVSGFARVAGLLCAAAPDQKRTKQRIRRLKEEQGRARDIMIIGSTGAGTFARPDGDLHDALMHCRKAEIMLLDPASEGAEIRARTIHSSQVTPELFREQIMESIRFLKTLAGLQKDIRLKLYSDPPLMKMAVLGDIISVMDYPPGTDAGRMSETVWKHDADSRGMYHLFLHYFHSRWNDVRIPEYDLKTDTLVYRDGSGKETARRSMDSLSGRVEVTADPLTALV